MSVMLINVVILCLLMITAIAIDRQRNLFSTIMLTAIYSLLCAVLFICLDAVDVAFTEAAVGGGVATIFFLGALAVTGFKEKSDTGLSITGLLVVSVTACLLVYGLADIPPFGLADNPVQTYLAAKYVDESAVEIGIPNLVTSILASYRGYDTLGETMVIFTAGVGILMLLERNREERKNLSGGDH